MVVWLVWFMWLALLVPSAAGFVLPTRPTCHTASRVPSHSPSFPRCGANVELCAVQKQQSVASRQAAGLKQPQQQRQHEQRRQQRKQMSPFAQQLKQARGSMEVQRLIKEHHRPLKLKEYTMVISAFGRSRDWKRALEILEEMRSSGVQPDVVAYSAAITACAKSGEADKALALLAEMRAAGHLRLGTAMAVDVDPQALL